MFKLATTLLKVGNYKVPRISEYNQTTSTIVDSGRNVKGVVVGGVVRENVAAVDVSFNYISCDVWSNILKQFDSNYGGSFYQWVTFFDQVSKTTSKRKMYVGDRTTGGLHILDRKGNPKAWLNAKLSLVEK